MSTELIDHIEQTVIALNNGVSAGLKSGQEIGRRESAAKIAELERDCLTLALRLYGEDADTFAPETAEVMDRWRVRVAELLAVPSKSQALRGSDC